MLSPVEISELRLTHYNAALIDLQRLHNDLCILRVMHDEGPREYIPGQYAVLGLGLWEPRCPNVQPEIVPEDQIRRLAKRAYSISCPMIAESGVLLRKGNHEWLEFYVSLVRRAEAHSPVLTPRLFALAQGDRLWMGDRPKGAYGLHPRAVDDAIVFISTGTGEAPHNAMLPELLGGGHRGPILNITCVRNRADLGYFRQHGLLEEHFTNYHYVALTTRETENLDPKHPHYVGKQYPQDFFESGRPEEILGGPFEPGRTHVYLCGNPAMIGLPLAGPEGTHSFPTPPGMAEILTRRGFTLDQPHEPGNVHFERYW